MALLCGSELSAALGEWVGSSTGLGYLMRPAMSELHDVRSHEWIAATPLATGLVVLGLYPAPVIILFSATVKELAAIFRYSLWSACEKCSQLKFPLFCDAGIFNDRLSLDDLAVPRVFRIPRSTLCDERCDDDQRVMDRKPMAFRAWKPKLMCFQGYGCDVANSLNDVQRIPNFWIGQAGFSRCY
jgi:hypothetical protein